MRSIPCWKEIPLEKKIKEVNKSVDERKKKNCLQVLRKRSEDGQKE